MNNTQIDELRALYRVPFILKSCASLCSCIINCIYYTSYLPFEIVPPATDEGHKTSYRFPKILRAGLMGEVMMIVGKFAANHVERGVKVVSMSKK